MRDEIQIRKRIEFRRHERETKCLEAGKIYSHLKKNYEENREFKSAGHFHYGELEMARMSHRTWLGRLLFSWDALYWLISGYGERFYRSLAILLLLLGAFAGLYWLTGIATTGPNVAATTIEKVLDHVLFSLTVPPLKPFGGYEPITKTASYIRLANSLAIPLMVAFALLAVRRRYKR